MFRPGARPARMPGDGSGLFGTWNPATGPARTVLTSSGYSTCAGTVILTLTVAVNPAPGVASWTHYHDGRPSAGPGPGMMFISNRREKPFSG